MTWHELHDDFFPEWYRRVDTYRQIEKKLGIAPLPIVINEYTRDRGDLAVPGQLVQWITRLEDSKAYGCLAFWTPSGTLADLTARIWPNRPTGAWWLYYWYGAMTGNTLKVTPPDRNAPGLQGVATYDQGKEQVSVIFGGTAQSVQLKLVGLGSLPAFRSGVHATLAQIASSGIEPSPKPVTLVSRDYPPAGPDFNLPVPSGDATSAYSIILTPPWSAAEAGGSNERAAVEADLDAGARPLYMGPQGPRVALNRANAAVRFIASVEHDGYYRLRPRLAVSQPGAAPGPGVTLDLDDQPARPFAVSSAPSTSAAAQTVFLAAGIHRFRLATAAAGTSSIELQSLSISPATGSLTTYEAGDPANTLGGTAHVSPAAGSGDAATEAVGGLGPGPANFVQFNKVEAAAAGRYKLIVTYANDSKGHKGQVEEQVRILVNGQPSGESWFRNTFSSSTFATTVLDLELAKGRNTVRLFSPAGQGPLIRKVQIAHASLP